eukprot:symbB.v1.2.007789.t1/scaffold484.1/size197819/7
MHELSSNIGAATGLSSSRDWRTSLPRFVRWESFLRSPELMHLAKSWDHGGWRGIHFVPLVRLGDGDMGRKANNLPARLARKKKVKDKNNLQIQGRAGLGRRREKARLERQKQRQKPREAKEVDPPKEQAQLSYVELAKQQEQKAEASAAANQASQVVQAAAQSKKARRKQRKRLASADAERCGVFTLWKRRVFSCPVSQSGQRHGRRAM